MRRATVSSPSRSRTLPDGPSRSTESRRRGCATSAFFAPWRCEKGGTRSGGVIVRGLFLRAPSSRSPHFCQAQSRGEFFFRVTPKEVANRSARRCRIRVLQVPVQGTSMVSIDDRLNQIIRELIGNGITLEQAVEAFEGKYIVAAMTASRGNVTQASKALGVHRNTLHNKLRTQTMLNGFAESIRPARRRLSARRVSAPSPKNKPRPI